MEKTSLEEQGVLMLSDGQYLFFVDSKIYLIQDFTTQPDLPAVLVTC